MRRVKFSILNAQKLHQYQKIHDSIFSTSRDLIDRRLLKKNIIYKIMIFLILILLPLIPLVFSQILPNWLSFLLIPTSFIALFVFYYFNSNTKQTLLETTETSKTRFYERLLELGVISRSSPTSKISLFSLPPENFSSKNRIFYDFIQSTQYFMNKLNKLQPLLLKTGIIIFGITAGVSILILQISSSEFALHLMFIVLFLFYILEGVLVLILLISNFLSRLLTLESVKVP